ncbi:hypothetical protein [Salinicoccus albus]|nr:hypothetical protein [Salinicoccus albus]
MSVKRDNLIKTAELLFYEYGFRGIGLAPNIVIDKEIKNNCMQK